LLVGLALLSMAGAARDGHPAPTGVTPIPIQAPSSVPAADLAALDVRVPSGSIASTGDRRVLVSGLGVLGGADRWGSGRSPLAAAAIAYIANDRLAMETVGASASAVVPAGTNPSTHGSRAPPAV
jgi:hypothetical protein